MKIQKQLSKKRGKNMYHKYVIVIPSNLVDEAGFSEGDELDGETKRGEIKLRKRQYKNS